MPEEVQLDQQIYQGSTKRMDNLLNNMHKEYIRIDHLISVSYTHLTLPTIYSV